MDEENRSLPAAPMQVLHPEGSREILLSPQTRVLCIHRGRRELDEAGRPIPLEKRHYKDPRYPLEVACLGDYTDTYDSKHYIIQPGYFECELGAAVHFKDRAVVPGSRNPETNYQASFLAIIGVVAVDPATGGWKILKGIDDSESWAPFSDEECAQYGMAVEALDRDNMQTPIDEKVDVVKLGGGSAGPASRVKGGAAGGVATGGKKGKKTDINATDAEILNPIPPGENPTLRQIAADRQAAGQGKD